MPAARFKGINALSRRGLLGVAVVEILEQLVYVFLEHILYYDTRCRRVEVTPILHRKDLKSGLAIYLTLSLLFGIISLGGSVPQVRAASPDAPINLYFHNDTSNPFVGGGFTRSRMTINTTQAWSSQPQGFVNFTSRASVDFYLHPDMAGSFTINGTLWLHPWVVGSTTSKTTTKASFTVTIADVSLSSGQVIVGSTPSSGSLNVAFGNPSSPAMSTDVNSVLGNAGSPLLMSIGTTHTFLPGHSILVHVEILPQASGILGFYFDNQITPSYVTLYVQPVVTVANTWTTDAAGASVATFAPSAGNLQVDMLANVTDPLGGYDINASTLGSAYARVTVNLTSPTGAQLLSMQRMNLISGGQLGFENIFRLNYTLSAPFPGQYNFTVTAVDNTGNVAIGNGFFHVGQVYRLQAEAIDAKGRALVSATIRGQIQGFTVFAQDTNALGWIDRLVVSGSYNLSVVWRGTVVNTTLNFLITQNSTIVLHCAVFDPKFQALDDVYSGLPEAEIFIRSPNGTSTTYPFFSDASGFVNLTESQGGDYHLIVLWKSVVVFNNTVTVTSDGPFAFRTQVYQVTVIAQGADKSKIQGALIAVHSPTSAEIVYSFGLTNSTGAVVFRLPVGQYKIEGYFSTTYLLTAINSPPVIETITVQTSHTETLTFQGFPPPITSTIAFQLGALFLLLIIVAAALGYFMGKRGRGKASPAKVEP